MLDPGERFVGFYVVLLQLNLLEKVANSVSFRLIPVLHHLSAAFPVLVFKLRLLGSVALMSFWNPSLRESGLRLLRNPIHLNPIPSEISLPSLSRVERNPASHRHKIEEAP